MPVDRSPRERRSRDISVFRNQHSKPVSGVFPTIYSTLSVEALVSQVLSQYAIAPVVSCCFWHRGLSDVYLVKTEKRPYILRVSHHHWRSAADIYFELNLLDFFRQQGLPVAHPLQTTDNQIAVTINAPEGQRYAALFVYADGEVPLGDLNVAQSRQLGEILAKLHCASLSFQTPFRRDDLCEEYLFDRSFETISPFLQHRPRDLDYLNEAIAHSKSCLQALPKTEPYWVVCWGDPHSGNAHFTPDGGVTLFDFDQCGYGWRAFDLAKFLHIALRTGISRGIRNGFLEGYQSVSPLAEKEVEMLQPLTQAAHFWSWAIALTNAAFHNYSRLDDSYFTQRLEQLKLLRSHDWQLF
ncbi:Homoserine kinase [Geitlerinema sp. FC II]|nr:homoserine kinase [Geitlerinema sp. CS-897]PPT10123.1 Homoserine kinase [Geitlerinema sp. FC II]